MTTSLPPARASRYTVEVEWAPYGKPDASGGIDLSQTQVRQVVVDADDDNDATLQAAQIAAGVAPGWNEKPNRFDYPTNPIVPKGPKGMVTRVRLVRGPLANPRLGLPDVDASAALPTALILRDVEVVAREGMTSPANILGSIDGGGSSPGEGVVSGRLDGEVIWSYTSPMLASRSRVAGGIGVVAEMVEGHAPGDGTDRLLKQPLVSHVHSDSTSSQRLGDLAVSAAGEACSPQPASVCDLDFRPEAFLDRDAWRSHEGMVQTRILRMEASLEGWRPTRGMFEPGKPTLDPRVFDVQTEVMRPEVRDAVLRALDSFFRPLFGDWTYWAKPYLAGSAASYWYDSDGDFDVLIGVDLARLREVRPQNVGVADDLIVAHLDRLLKDFFDPAYATSYFVVGSTAWSSATDGRRSPIPTLTSGNGSTSVSSTASATSLDRPEPPDRPSRTAFVDGDSSSTRNVRVSSAGPALPPPQSASTAGIEVSSGLAGVASTTHDGDDTSASWPVTGSVLTSSIAWSSVRAEDAPSVESRARTSASIMTTPAVQHNRIRVATASEGSSADDATTRSGTSGTPTFPVQPAISQTPPASVPPQSVVYGPVALTAFVNPGSYDIRAIKPYAAYDLIEDGWIVHPPVLPADWGPDKFAPEVWQHFDQIAREAEGVLAIPDPAARHQACVALFDRLHTWRQLAYTEHGKGWLDLGNVYWQALSQTPERLLQRLYEVKHDPAFEVTAAVVYDDARQAYWQKQLNSARIAETKPAGKYVLHLGPVEDTDEHGDYRYIYASHNGEYVGHVFFGPHPTWPDHTEGAVEVVPQHRRRGVASAMYDYAAHVSGKPMAPADRHSDEAEQFWRHRRAAGFEEDRNNDYAWQVAEEHAQVAKKLSGQEFEDFCKQVIKAETGKTLRVKFDLLYGASASNDYTIAAAWYDPDEKRAYIGWSVAGLNDATALHEVAHVLNDYRNGHDHPGGAHGPGWKAIYSDLLRKYSEHWRTAGVHGTLPEGMTYQTISDRGDGQLRRHFPEGMTFRERQGRNGNSRGLFALDPAGYEMGRIAWREPDGEIIFVYTAEEHQRKGVATELLRQARARNPKVHHSADLSPEGKAWSEKVGALDTKDYVGREGDRSHITRTQRGTIPTEQIAHLLGVRGEKPGEHRNRLGEDWEKFKADIAASGIKDPIFITVDPGEEPKINEGNHRRDAAVELRHPEVPVEIRYFGHAERHHTFGGPVSDRIPQAMRRMIPDRLLKEPRPVVLDRGAEDDLKKLPGDVRNALVQAVHAIEDGIADLEAKARALAGAYSVRLTNKWRALLYVGKDLFWHLWSITDHDYDEATRRWGSLRVTTTHLRFGALPAVVPSGPGDGLLAVAGLAECGWVWSVPRRRDEPGDGPRLVMGTGQWTEASWDGPRPLRVLHALLCSAGSCSCGDPTGERVAQRYLARGAQCGEGALPGGSPLRHDGWEGRALLPSLSSGSDSSVSRTQGGGLTDHDYDEVQRRFSALKTGDPTLDDATDAWESDISMEITHAAAQQLRDAGVDTQWSGGRQPEELHGYARTLMGHAQPLSHVTYHGVSANQQFRPGDEDVIPLRAVSRDEGTAGGFANPGGYYPDENTVHEYHGAHGVPINNHEHVITGRYRVRSVMPHRVVWDYVGPHRLMHTAGYVKQIRNVEPGEVVPANRSFSGEDEQITDILPGTKYVKVTTDADEPNTYAFTPRTRLAMQFLNRPVEIAEFDVSHVSTTRCVVAFVDAGSMILPLGFLTWDPRRKTIELIYVNGEMRRQGLASKLHDAADAIDGPLAVTGERSPLGTEFARSTGKDVPKNTRPLKQRDAEGMGGRMMMALHGLSSEDIVGHRREAKTAARQKIYRGIRVELPPELDEKVQRLKRMPTTEEEINQHLNIGPLLLDHLQHSGYSDGYSPVGLGRHWTTRKEMAGPAAQGAHASADRGGLPALPARHHPLGPDDAAGDRPSL